MKDGEVRGPGTGAWGVGVWGEVGEGAEIYVPINGWHRAGPSRE